MSQFELNILLKKDFSLHHLWKMIRLCNNIIKKEKDERFLVILNTLERLAELRDGEAVDADLAEYQDSCLRELALKTLAGNKGAMEQLKKIEFINK